MIKPSLQVARLALHEILDQDPRRCFAARRGVVVARQFHGFSVAFRRIEDAVRCEFWDHSHKGHNCGVELLALPPAIQILAAKAIDR